jgi:histidinol-phosphate aminotransferase
VTELDELLRPDLRGRTPYGAPQLDVAVRLNTNESSYAVPEPVVRAALDALALELPGLNRYPDREFTALREALSTYLAGQASAEIPVAGIWAANGSNEVLLHLVQAFGGAQRVALGFTPAYSMHPIIARTCGMTWVDGDRGAPGDPFGLTAESVAKQCRATAPHLVFLCSPNNPTGTALPGDVVEAAYDSAPQAVVVVDEAYAEYARPGTRSALHLLDGRPRLAVTRTMSKAFALAGGRLGYLGADPALVDALRLVRMPYHLSTQTQVLARVALDHAADLLATVEATKDQRDRIVRELGATGLTPVPSDANFVLFGGLVDERMTWQHLLDQGVLVRDVGIPHHLRVSAGTEAETDAFLAAVQALPAEHRLAATPNGKGQR